MFAMPYLFIKLLIIYHESKSIGMKSKSVRPSIRQIQVILYRSKKKEKKSIEGWNLKKK